MPKIQDPLPVPPRSSCRTATTAILIFPPVLSSVLKLPVYLPKGHSELVDEKPGYTQKANKSVTIPLPAHSQKIWKYPSCALRHPHPKNKTGLSVMAQRPDLTACQDAVAGGPFSYRALRQVPRNPRSRRPLTSLSKYPAFSCLHRAVPPPQGGGGSLP